MAVEIQKLVIDVYITHAAHKISVEDLKICSRLFENRQMMKAVEQNNLELDKWFTWKSEGKLGSPPNWKGPVRSRKRWQDSVTSAQ
jgi:hypothetical protein